MCFGGGSSASPAPPPPPPPSAPIQGPQANAQSTLNSTLAAQQAAGYASTILTGPGGVGQQTSTTGKTLLGGS